MRSAGAIAIAVALGGTAPALAGAGAVELAFGSGSTGHATTRQTSHLDLAAELAMPGDFRLDLAVNSNTYEATGDDIDTLVLGVAPSWQANDSLRLTPYYERNRSNAVATASDLDNYGLEAGFLPEGPVELTAYWGQYRGADWGDAPSANYGVSARVGIGEKVSAYAFARRDTFDGGWWQDAGLGADRQLDGSGIGLTVLFTERRYSFDSDPLQTVFFGGTIAIGKVSGWAPEFRAHHCVMCELPL
jgi:hypothetical protein